jgi:hypothetical protein
MMRLSFNPIYKSSFDNFPVIQPSPQAKYPRAMRRFGTMDKKSASILMSSFSAYATSICNETKQHSDTRHMSQEHCQSFQSRGKHKQMCSTPAIRRLATLRRHWTSATRRQALT